jgi:hypothetical protein
MTLAKRTREQHQMPAAEPPASDSGREQSIREDLF